MNNLGSTHRSISLARTIVGFILLAAVLAACERPIAPSPFGSSNTPQVAQPSSSIQAPTSPTQASAPTSTGINCAAPAALTPEQTEGPFFKAGSPERAVLIDANTKGTTLVLTGYVVTPDCKPIAHALMEFWQADAAGNYDNAGYMLRGHQYTDANGRYQLTTIVPGLYPGRTEHIHVKIQAPTGPMLTTQLYFPDVAQNESDGIFEPKMVMDVQPADNGLTATYIFVVREH